MTSKTIGYFQFDEDEFSVAVVTKTYWDENACLDDTGSESEHMPEKFFELGESVYEHEYDSVEEAKAALVSAGFEEKEMF